MDNLLSVNDFKSFKEPKIITTIARNHAVYFKTL